MLRSSLFYVQLTNEEGNTVLLIDAIRCEWDAIWVEQNQRFEQECK